MSENPFHSEIKSNLRLRTQANGVNSGVGKNCHRAASFYGYKNFVTRYLTIKGLGPCFYIILNLLIVYRANE